MSELLVKNPPNALIVASVDFGSPSQRAGLQPGDLLRSINGRPILDILDYQFHAAENRLVMEIDRDGAAMKTVIRLQEGQSPGISFANDLGDKIHTCNNKCVFCFIHQMPKKMRKTLYLMDDDFRLSFMHGHYVTLTNVTQDEMHRILEQRLSPLYVSVHATDPELRGVMLGKKGPAPILPTLDLLHENRIDVHAQIVLCPGWNDGDALIQTLNELAEQHPSVTGRRSGTLSAAIVPVGLTKFRERLPKLQSADRDYARAMIDTVSRVERSFNRRLGTRFAWLSDEWYFLAEQPMPGRAHYEDFPQLEDGVGTVRLFQDEAGRVTKRLPQAVSKPVGGTVITSVLPAQVIEGFVDRLNQVDGVQLKVKAIENRFFGGGVNVAGLITATDILEQLAEENTDLPVYLPSVCLKEGSLFLDDMTVEELSAQLGRPVVALEKRPNALAQLVMQAA